MAEIGYIENCEEFLLVITLWIELEARPDCSFESHIIEWTVIAFSSSRPKNSLSGVVFIKWVAW